MYELCLSSVYSPCDTEDSILSKEKIEEISDKVSQSVSEEILKQIEKIITSSNKKEEK